jgi:hypothetical protein
MIYYLNLIAAVILGQTFVAAVVSWIYQRKNDKVNYLTATKIYMKHEVGTFAVIFSFTLMVLFALSDWMDLNVSKAELLSRGKDGLSRFEHAQLKFRTYALCYGVFVQYLAFLFYKGGIKAILTWGQKNAGVDIEKVE